MQWVYRLFHGVHVLKIETKELSQELVINMNPLQYESFIGENSGDVWDSCYGDI